MSHFKFGSIVQGVTSTATAAGTTTLTNTSSQIQNFTGTTTQTVVLPDATTMKNGMSFEIYNSSTGALTVNKNGGSLVSTVASGIALVVKLTDNSSSAGTWVIQSSASTSSSSGINYITDYDGSAIGSWVTYKDAVQTIPVDGTGGAPTVTYAVSTSSALRGTSNFLFTHAASNQQGEGFSYNFTIDPSDKGKVLQISFEYLVASGTYADDDLQFWIYDVTNAALIQPAPYKLKNSGIIEKFAMEFQTSSSSTSYRLIAHVATSTATAYTIQFDNWNLGPQAKLYGSAVTDWVSYTPTGSWTDNSPIYTGQWRRVGDSMELNLKVVCGGVPTAAALTINLPSGFSIDSNKYIVGQRIGTVYVEDAGVAGYEGFVYISSSTSIGLSIQIVSGTYEQSSAVSSTVPFSFNTNDFATAVVKVPISGWSSSVVMSSDTDTRVVSMIGYKSGSQALTAVATKITFDTKTEDTHGAFDFTTNYRYTVPVPGTYIFRVATSFSTSSTGGISDFVLRKNGSAVSGQTQYIPMSATLPSGGTVSFKATAIAGDYFEIWTTPQFSVTLNAATLQIERIAGPSQIMASETVSALYTGAPPTGTLNSTPNTVTYGTKVKDSHGAYSSGSYTVPSAGQYDIGAAVDITHVSIAVNQYIGVAIYIDGVQKYVRYTWAASVTVVELMASIDVKSIPLLAGQVITIRPFSTGTTPSYVSSAATNNLYINRSGNY